MSWVTRARTWKRRRVKACRVCQFPHHSSRAPDRLRTDALTLTRRPLCLLSYGAQYARRELNPHQLGSQPSPSTCCGTSAWSLWTVSNRLPSPYEEDALAR